RKETKDHGEGGNTFGAGLQGKVVIIDDVISAGTSVNLSVDIITAAGAQPVAAAVAMDRQERGLQALSAVQEVERRHGIKVISIITLDDMIEYLTSVPGMTEKLEQIREYRQVWGIKTAPA
ncbi:MAG TPA: phosphoribosyltransferase family protein, partial [Gammaproteobacteria bacterium]|nr:phosphoribosyltransferase family protein [Gammaproteobacteria bacterium]